jgi:SAM-dependent methyltransferase
MDADDLRTGYDQVAEDYAAQFGDELASKPLDRALLNAFAEQVPAGAPVADVGCGPGQVAAYLADRGVPTLGVDLSPGMVRVARRLHPRLEFRTGSLLELPTPDCAWAGVTAFYSIIHLEPDALPSACDEFYRVLVPDGLLLLAFHAGREVRHLDEWFGHPVSLDFYFFDPDDVADLLSSRRFSIEARLVRGRYPHEVDTRRAYLLARKVPGG